jgi:hypothetical protein
VNGRDRPVPPNTDEMYWARFLADLDALGEIAHPGGEDDGALAGIVALAREPLDLGDDEDDGGDEQPRTPPPRPRRRAAKAAARQKRRMPTPFVKVKPAGASRARYVIDVAKRKVLTAGGAQVAGGWAVYVAAEEQRAARRRTVVASALPVTVVTPATSTSSTTIVTTTTTAVRPEGS